MTNQEKRLILILLAISVIIIGGLLIWRNSSSKNGGQQDKTPVAQQNVEEYVQHLEDGSKLNVSDELLSTKTLDGLEFTNIQLREVNGVTTLLADVENKTGGPTKSKMVKIEILDKQGSTITSLVGEIDPIATGEKVQLNVAATSDVANAYDFKISNLK